MEIKMPPTALVAPEDFAPVVSTPLQWSGYFDRYYNQGTREIYLRDIKEFFGGELPVTSEEFLKKAHPEEVLLWRNEMSLFGLKAVTINRKLSALRTFFDYALAAGVINRNPAHTKLVAPLKAAKWEPDISLGIDDVKAMLTCCYEDKQSVRGFRDRAIISLGFTSILRRSEIVGLSWPDIVRGGKDRYILKLREAKGGEGETVPLDAMTKKLIEEYLVCFGSPQAIREDQKGLPIFISLSRRTYGKRLNANSVGKIVKRRAAQAGLPAYAVHPHLLRHAGITYLLENGEDLAKVQLFARHKDPKTTMVYNDAIQKFQNSAADKLSRGLFDI
jgi:site-specific recombinase XerD